MKRTTLLVALAIPSIIIALLAIKSLQIKTLIDLGETAVIPPTKVTYSTVQHLEWPQIIQTVASLEANQAVNIAAESPGRITHIAFRSGQEIQNNDLLIKQDVSIELAQLKAAKSALTLTNNQLARVKKLKKQQNTSQAALEDALANVVKAEADIDIIQATIKKKTVTAPFTGLLGIRQVNIGQELSQGDVIVSLQQMDPMLINFNLPQRYRPLIKVGLPLNVQAEKQQLPSNQKLVGNIVAIDPNIDPHTRNISIQAKINNPEKLLMPGMFVNIALDVQKTQKYLAVPVTAIRYAPYGNSVFVVDNNQTPAIVRQQIVETGETRGDFIAIKKGLIGDEIIVTSGAFKLSNGQSIELDNSKSPTFKTVLNK